MKPTYVLGVDSSTQSCKALLVDAHSGQKFMPSTRSCVMTPKAGNRVGIA